MKFRSARLAFLALAVLLSGCGVTPPPTPVIPLPSAPTSPPPDLGSVDRSLVPTAPAALTSQDFVTMAGQLRELFDLRAQVAAATERQRAATAAVTAQQAVLADLDRQWRDSDSNDNNRRERIRGAQRTANEQLASAQRDQAAATQELAAAQARFETSAGSIQRDLDARQQALDEQVTALQRRSEAIRSLIQQLQDVIVRSNPGDASAIAIAQTQLAALRSQGAVTDRALVDAQSELIMLARLRAQLTGGV